MKVNFLYGTAWKEDLTSECVFNALKVGYRGIDTANQRKHYNEPAVGEGIQKAYEELGIKRKELFLQSKFTFASGQDERKPYDDSDSIKVQVRKSFESSLKHLHTDYLDSLILHGPDFEIGINDADKEAWGEMEELFREGLVKNIGVSNTDISQLRELFEFATIKPHFAQIRCFAQRRWEKQHRDFCKENGITFQGFSLLTANRDFLGCHITKPDTQSIPKLNFFEKYDEDTPFGEILKATGKKPAQVIFKFCQQMDILPLTGTRTIENMKLNLDIDDFELTEGQLKEIEEISFHI
ncbi:hypothetical protein A9Q84_18130 [Halobacteriovorax marinus]|uniref:NADP-dependent oxidoreductase domain-containing protein n=1 Tax=Halobacteriovorax marinus TaxID=97084 RepID=A0A1Y5F3F6_9BACT|nr:hypothetical protein A9Q84_18130 [Halobacteriovorax marinus]